MHTTLKDNIKYALIGKRFEVIIEASFLRYQMEGFQQSRLFERTAFFEFVP